MNKVLVYIYVMPTNLPNKSRALKKGSPSEREKERKSKNKKLL